MQLNPYQPTKQTEGRNVNEVRGDADPAQPIAFYIAGIMVAGGSFLIWPLTDSFYGFLLDFAFAFGPLVLAMLPMWFWRNLMSQLILIFGAIAYAVWFLLLYLAVRNARDPMSGLLIFYIGPIASPFLLVICGISLAFHLRRNQD